MAGGKKMEKTKRKKFFCSVCGIELSQEEYDNHDGMCWVCSEDQLTEEAEMMFGDVM
jgi:hypothetical protein